MAIEVVMPRLGWTMEEGSVVEWLKRDGEMVRAGEILFTIESDKAVNEVEALDSGVLRIPPNSPPPGTAVPIGTVLAYLDQPGEHGPAGEVAGPRSGVLDGVTVPPVVAGGPDPARRVTRAGAPAVSPRARRVAGELGVDWTRLRGSGRAGRIVERDVRAAASASSPRPAPLPTTSLGGIRRLTAARLSESARVAVPVTLTTEADVTRLARLREEMRADLAGAEYLLPSYTDLFARLTAVALVEHPALNASLVDDAVIQHPAVHIGIAVDTERGLLVPVVRAAQARSLAAITAETVRLIAAAREGTIGPDELTGSTFTITNLGMHEIDVFTPVINMPECAILGLGRVVPRQVVLDEASETVGIRKMMALSLTFDHRVVDGAPAARFLQRVKRLAERPTLWLMR